MSDTIEEVLEQVKKHTPSVGAMILAEYLHKDQTYGDQSYFQGHLSTVAALVKSELVGSDWAYRELVVAIAWLHDSIEDTEATYDMLSKYFGHTVAIGVQYLSDVEGKNRRERKLKTYHRIRISPESVMIKVADRLVNMRNCELHNKELLKMYLKEHDTFFAALWHPNQTYQEWWDEMEQIKERNSRK